MHAQSHSELQPYIITRVAPCKAASGDPKPQVKGQVSTKWGGQKVCPQVALTGGVLWRLTQTEQAVVTCQTRRLFYILLRHSLTVCLVRRAECNGSQQQVWPSLPLSLMARFHRRVRVGSVRKGAVRVAFPPPKSGLDPD